MKRTLAVMLCLIFPMVAFAGTNGYKIIYDGGSVPNLKPGTHLKLVLNNNHIEFLKGSSVIENIPASAVTEISYGQDVHRRVGAAVGVGVVTLGAGALLALAKSKKHYIGITWADANSKGGIAYQADKSDYRGQLLGLEGVTGKTAVNASTMNVKN